MSRPLYPGQNADDALRRSMMEWLPRWLTLIPLVLNWCRLALRYTSLTLPSAANPRITSGGLVGEGKDEYFRSMGAFALSHVAAFIVVRCHGRGSLVDVLSAMDAANIAFPVMAKPNIGWCGYGVRRLDDAGELGDYLQHFPPNETLVLQRYLNETGEAGIFYARDPLGDTGHVVGLLLRHVPTVTGDGVSPIDALIRRDHRLCRASHSHAHEFRQDHAILAPGQTARVSSVGSARVGARYEDAESDVTAQLAGVVESIMRDMPEFYIGRLDVRYQDIEGLRRGEFTIMEVNGAGSEAGQAWDPRYSIRQAYRIVFAKQRLLFELGACNRRRGIRPMGPFALLRSHLHQQHLIARYPPSN